MDWLIFVLVVILFLTGLTKPLLALILLWAIWKLAPRGTKQRPARPGPAVRQSRISSEDVFDLFTLRQELTRLHQAGELDEIGCDTIHELIDSVLKRELGRSPPEPASLSSRAHCERAWSLLERHASHPLGAPPWKKEERGGEGAPEPRPRVELRRPAKTAAVAEKQVPSAASRSRQATDEPPVHQPRMESPPQAEKPAPDPPPQPPSMLRPSGPIIAGPSPSLSETPSSSPPPAAPLPTDPTRPPEALFKPDPGPPRASATPAESYAWRPSEPSKLEQALEAVSGWHRLLIPFLAQNIGWFIGGLCFVGGSIFLVTYTAGFGKALTVFAVLSVYSLLFIWGGYQLKRRRPELLISSSVLLSLGVLLIPITLASAARLVVAGMEQGRLLAVAAATAVLGCMGFYVAVRIASGVMERTLAHQHARLFLALAAAQLALPFLNWLPHWSLLALLHLSLLALLGWALILFARHWLRSVFVERRKTAYYTAGTLVFAALVSFLHLTWGTAQAIPLPAGYYGPFLMLACCLLFYVDAQFKRWTHEHPFLSHFSIFLYGLSVSALALAAGESWTTVLTLLPAIVLFAFVVWNYLTLTPLYLLLGCGFWLYHQVVLQFLPAEGYLLAGLPGLLGLHWANRWALRRRSPALALIVYRTLALLLVGLTGWSLSHGEPGLTAFATALAATVLIYAALGNAPVLLLAPIPKDPAAASWDSRADLREGPWFYAVTVMAAVAVAYAPLWFGLDWNVQTALGLLALSAAWARQGIARYRRMREVDRAKMEAFLNSTLVALVLSAALAWQTPRILHILFLAAAGGVWFWLGLNLRDRLLIYAALLVWGIGVAVAETGYLSAPAHALLGMLAAMAVWEWLWRLRRKADAVAALGREEPEPDAGTCNRAKLLWCLPVDPYRSGGRYALLKPPLQQVLVLLWTIALIQLLMAGLSPSLTWAFAAASAVPATILLAGQFRLLELLPLAVLLAVIALLAALHTLIDASTAGLLLAAALASVCLWHLSLASLAHPLTHRFVRLLRFDGGYGNLGGRALTEQTTRWTVFAVSAGAAVYLVVLAPPLGTELRSSPFALAAWVACAYFWWHSGRRYGAIGHSYLTLAAVAVTTLLFYSWLHGGASMGKIASDAGLGILFGFAGLALWGVARVLEIRATGDASADFERSLYRKPLRIAAVLFALAAVVQQGFLTPTGITPESAFALGLASMTLLVAGCALHRFPLDLTAFLGIALTLLWTQALLFHGGEFSLWPADRRFSDLWPTLGLLALGFHGLSRHPFGKVRHGEALAAAAAVCYVWALVGTLLLFAFAPLAGDPFLPWSFLILTLGPLPLLRSSPMAFSIRGPAVPLLSGALWVSLIAVFGLAVWIRTFTVAWAYLLLATAAFLLPRFNARLPHYAIDPSPWSWIGLFAALIALLPAWEPAFVCAAVFYALAFWAVAARPRAEASRGADAEALIGVSAESPAHLTAFVLTLGGSLLAVARVSPFMPNQGAGLAIWLTLAGAGLFLWLAGLRYRARLHSYLVASLAPVATLLLYARIQGGRSLDELAGDSGLGLAFTLTGLALWAVARRLDARAVGDASVDFGRSLYRRPLRIGAVLLALASIVQQWIFSPSGIEPAGVLALGFACLTLLVAGYALRRFSLDLAAFLGIALTLLWTQALLMHGGEFSLWPADRRFSDLWPTVGILVLTLHGVGRLRMFQPHYGETLAAAAAICYVWALVGTLSLFAFAPLAGDPFLPWSLLLLTLALLPLLRGSDVASLARGLGVPLLLTALLVSVIAVAGLASWLRTLSMGWAYVLWGASVFLLPRFNARWPHYAIDPAPWPWIGLACFGAALGTAVFDLPANPLYLPVSPALLSFSQVFWDAGGAVGSAWKAANLDAMLFAAALYLLLMIRQSPGTFFPAAGVLALLFAGIAAIVEILPPALSGINNTSALAVVVGSMLLWSNLLLLGTSLWRRFGQNISNFLGWRAADLAGPLGFWPLLIIVQPLLALAVLEGLKLTVHSAAAQGMPLLLLALLILSLLHAFWLRQNELRSHLLIASLFFSALAIGSGWFAPPLLLSLWSFTLTAFRGVAAFKSWGREGALPKALGLWLRVSPLLALASLLVTKTTATEELLSFSLLTASAASLGLQLGRRIWLYGALAMLIILLHRWPLHWLPAADPLLLLPWYALQLAAAAWLLQGFRGRTPDTAEMSEAFRRNTLLPTLAGLACMEWLWHLTLLWRTIEKPVWLFTPWDAAAEITAGLLLLSLGIKLIRHTPDSPFIYGLAFFTAAIGLYVRLLWLGDSPTGVWDTAALLTAAYLLLGLQSVIRSAPLRRVGLLLPLIALLSVPMQLESMQASTSLFAIGALYLLMRRQSGGSLPLYLALLAFNVGVYLWVPDWAERSQLLQVYVAPAAVSVLILLHLHRRELKAHVLNGGRLAAASTLYACVTLDVFLTPDLSVFALAVALSLVGVVLGIALRIRAFLYTGTAFLVLNVLGQVLHLYPEQRLGKAIFLMAIGAAIIAFMIWFNLQREKIMQKIRIFRADLAAWE